jgi:hypothetical protein
MHDNKCTGKDGSWTLPIMNVIPHETWGFSGEKWVFREKNGFFREKNGVFPGEK